MRYVLDITTGAGAPARATMTALPVGVELTVDEKRRVLVDAIEMVTRERTQHKPAPRVAERALIDAHGILCEHDGDAMSRATRARDVIAQALEQLDMRAL